jgi:uncharacterized membrane protein
LRFRHAGSKPRSLSNGARRNSAREEAAAVEAQITVWLHLLSFAIYTGSTLAVALISVPAARAAGDGRSALRAIAAAMRIYDPLSIAMLGVMVMTGAFMLTAYKSALRAAFFEQIGRPLAWKLLFAFLLVNLGAYIAFGIGHRLVRILDSEQTVEDAWLESMLGRLRKSAVVAVLLAALTAWIALGMSRAMPRLPASP